jgi:hypothetical protein
MSQPTHDPPDPVLWGRVVEIWLQTWPVHGIQVYPPTDRDNRWHLRLETSFDAEKAIVGIGPTWDDAARALIAEWEGRSK